MERWELRRGMLVMHRNAREGGRVVLARVEKVNPKWIVIQYESGARWNSHPSSLSPAAPDAVFNIDEAEGLELGTVVRFLSKDTPSYPFVVIGISTGTYKLAKLGGGSKNRYYHSVPASDLVVLDLADALAHV